MKIENTSWVLMKIGRIDIDQETVYLSDDSENGFTNDIRLATKCNNRKTALSLKFEFELNKNNGNESDLKIVPIKITYEW